MGLQSQTPNWSDWHMHTKTRVGTVNLGMAEICVGRDGGKVEKSNADDMSWNQKEEQSCISGNEMWTIKNNASLILYRISNLNHYF